MRARPLMDITKLEEEEEEDDDDDDDDDKKPGYKRLNGQLMNTWTGHGQVSELMVRY